MIVTLLAQRINNPIAPGLSPASAGAGESSFAAIIQVIITWMFVIAALLFFAYFLIGGIRWITSGGDKNSIESARSSITQALIGLVVISALYVIVKLLEALLGIKLLELTIPKL